MNQAASPAEIRLFSRQERLILGVEGIDYLMKIERAGILQAKHREWLLEELHNVQLTKVNLDVLKKIVCLAVLYLSEEKEAQARFERWLLLEQSKTELPVLTFYHPDTN